MPDRFVKWKCEFCNRYIIAPATYNGAPVFHYKHNCNCKIEELSDDWGLFPPPPHKPAIAFSCKNNPTSKVGLLSFIKKFAERLHRVRPV